MINFEVKKNPDPIARIAIEPSDSDKLVIRAILALKHKLNYIFLPSEFVAGFVTDPLLPLSVCGVAS